MGESGLVTQLLFSLFYFHIHVGFISSSYTSNHLFSLAFPRDCLCISRPCAFTNAGESEFPPHFNSSRLRSRGSVLGAGKR